MQYRIKVGNPDKEGDVMVQLQCRRQWSPIWFTVEYTWVEKSGAMRTTLESTKAYFKSLAKLRENPAIKAHVENFDV